MDHNMAMDVHDMMMMMPMEDPNQLWLVPCYSVALIGNSILAVSMLRFKSAVLTSSLSTLLFALVVFFIIWSIVNIAVGSTIIAISNTDLMMRISAAVNSIGSVLVFGFNFVIALERYLIVRQFGSVSRRGFIVFAVYIAALVGVMTWVFVTSPSSDCFKPDYKLQLAVWLTANVLAFPPMYIGVIGFYFITYLHSKSLIDSVTKENNPKQQNLRAQLSKTVFRSCLAMSATMLLFYTPFVVLMFASVFVQQVEANMSVWMTVCNALVTVDSLVAPAVILYFNPMLRRMLADTLFRRKADAFEDDSIDGSTLQYSGRDDGRGFHELDRY
ncbi:hypothetical protein BDR26DRAFT_922747 [Obelidium mucronatum]|nr:hypothetical protein BDR26DRAFT_922747 [Obelidium mucronatum]